MRLFIAVEFSPSTKQALKSVTDRLRSHAVSGSFTRCENLHLTLAFLGETSRVAAITQAMELADLPAPFSFILTEAGRFSRSEGDLFWLGAAPSPGLDALHRALSAALRERGFRLDDRPFRAHVTLGRRVAPNSSFDLAAFSSTLPVIPVEVASISLMESCRIQGRLVYQSKYKRAL